MTILLRIFKFNIAFFGFNYFNHKLIKKRLPGKKIVITNMIISTCKLRIIYFLHNYSISLYSQPNNLYSRNYNNYK